MSDITTAASDKPPLLWSAATQTKHAGRPLEPLALPVMPDKPSPLRLTASQRLTWTAERAAAWAKYRESPHLAAPGSSLALDDQIFPASPPSHLIAHRIGHAVEHLEFLLYPLINGGVGYPTAPNTVARSGVVGASHALWMLDHPDRAERQRRALRMAHYEAAAERTALYEIKRVPGADEGGDAEQQQQRRAVWQSFMDRCDDIIAAQNWTATEPSPAHEQGSTRRT